jgi:hypothetical protein
VRAVPVPDPGDLRACCPIAAEQLNHLDVAIALVEQAAKGAISTAVPQLVEAVAGVVVVLGVEVDLSSGAIGQPSRFFAELDQAKAAVVAAIVAACPCTAQSP